MPPARGGYGLGTGFRLEYFLFFDRVWFVFLVAFQNILEMRCRGDASRTPPLHGETVCDLLILKKKRCNVSQHFASLVNLHVYVIKAV